MKKLKVGGIYNHYKNHLVKIIGVALHSETLEELVVYELTEDYNGRRKGQLWVRPKKMFLENVKVNGKVIPRFKLVK